jgi:hypothetical protein
MLEVEEVEFQPMVTKTSAKVVMVVVVMVTTLLVALDMLVLQI